ncbi:ACP-like domain-containing protein [Neisseria chenwenguii]|uniref:Adhesin n=1 Tax=Neisseria chenwenguii TaxID=1853278 RepID=A0A220S0G0_9NEIS|nr:adhesin [Neisseria chenwenguii]ASK26959.1 adhesin [Neisseria chenwenguii]ROV56139.1 adhesin [Neisseria chenwenguii]
MKKVSVILFAALAVMAGAAAQAAPSTSVQYACQNGKRVTVSYSFNRQELPTKAVAVVNGKRRIMPINLGRSDNIDTFFGKDGGYRLVTSYMDRKNFRTLPVMITDNRDRIVFKDCEPRRARY